MHIFENPEKDMIHSHIKIHKKIKSLLLKKNLKQYTMQKIKHIFDLF